MKGTWQTTGGGGGSGSSVVALAIGAAVGVVVIAPLLAAAVVALVKALVIAAVVLTVAVVVVWRLRSRRPVRELPVHRPLPQVQAQPARPAIEAPQALHLHFHGVDAEDVAAILREHGAR